MNMPDYFRSSANKAADKRAIKVLTNNELTNKFHNEFSNFSGISCFEGAFTLQLKDGSWPYQVSPRRVAYALKEPLKEELEITEAENNSLTSP